MIGASMLALVIGFCLGVAIDAYFLSPDIKNTSSQEKD